MFRVYHGPYKIDEYFVNKLSFTSFILPVSSWLKIFQITLVTVTYSHGLDFIDYGRFVLKFKIYRTQNKSHARLFTSNRS